MGNGGEVRRLADERRDPDRDHSQDLLVVATLERWHEVYEHADDLDPDNEMDWADFAFGFLLGAGIRPDAIATSWPALMSCGQHRTVIESVVWGK